MEPLHHLKTDEFNGHASFRVVSGTIKKKDWDNILKLIDCCGISVEDVQPVLEHFLVWEFEEFMDKFQRALVLQSYDVGHTSNAEI
jgi:hypothetical protein